MSSPLFSVGTSRGGTTFFARIMSLNDEVKMASDPFLPLFRSYRTAVLRRDIDEKFDESQPLNDYYFSQKQIEMMHVLCDADLETDLPDGEFDRLIPRIAARMGLAAKEAAEHVGDLRGTNYLELLQSGLKLLEKTYAAEESKFVGFNDNWAIEFLPALLRSFPEARGIVIVRDPRAAMASAMKLRVNDPSKAKKVPLMYSFAHHWRKHASFTFDLMNREEFVGRLMVVKYEDVVSDPEGSIRSVCDYLDVAYDPGMLVTDRFRPIKDGKWNGHSNFDAPSKGIYTNSISAWKSFLSDGGIELIEYVCGPEMNLHSYEMTIYNGGEPSDAVMDFLVEDDAKAIGWRNEHKDWVEELAQEKSRKELLFRGLDQVTSQDIEENYLFASVYKACRAHKENRLYNAEQTEAIA
jgi:hypothetical protein